MLDYAQSWYSATILCVPGNVSVIYAYTLALCVIWYWFERTDSLECTGQLFVFWIFLTRHVFIIKRWKLLPCIFSREREREREREIESLSIFSVSRTFLNAYDYELKGCSIPGILIYALKNPIWHQNARDVISNFKKINYELCRLTSNNKEDGRIWRTKCPFYTEYMYRFWVKSLKSALTLRVLLINVDTCSTTPSPNST